MTPETVFAAWAPAGQPWSPWAKPALFAQLDRVVTSASPATTPPAWANAGDFAAARLALVVDLPGERSALAGLTLAQAGFQPVPLYNTSYGYDAVIPLAPLMDALRQGAGELASLALPPSAPPAFLLDSRRTHEISAALPGRYDNRWLVFPQDFPSAEFLKSQGLRGAILLQETGLLPADDLAHVLLRWQEAGLSILSASADASPLAPEPIFVTKPPHYRMLWQHFLAVIGLRRNSAGGFGARIPVPSQGGGFA